MKISRALSVLVLSLGFNPTTLADPLPVRIVAANLSSGTQQSYSANNGNSSNLEGAGARILKGLKPDVVLIQEFNTSVNTGSWVSQTFGPEYEFSKESGNGIPNGVVSKYPIVAEGEWDDTTQSNRDFAWAKIRLLNGKHLWAVSVHLKSGGSNAEKRTRVRQAEILVSKIRANIPEADYLVLGGDFNTSSRDEECVRKLGEVLKIEAPHPVDQNGGANTNSNRNKPYDWVLADADLKAHQQPTSVGEVRFEAGAVIDTRRFDPISVLAPARANDSGVQNMQHMAVVKDFLIP